MIEAKQKAEYYFEYNVERVFGEESAVKTPKLYFERDYRFPDLPYSLFAVPDEWLRHDVLEKIRGFSSINEEAKKREVLSALDSLAYDEIRFIYDIKGINCAALSDTDSQSYQNAEIKETVTFEKFWQTGCRLILENSNSEDHSGIGVIEMLKKNVTVAKFFFLINFTFRKRISYSLNVSDAKVLLEFKCDDRPTGISVSLVYNKDRLPCLKNDMSVNVVTNFELDFSGDKVFKKTVHLSGESASRNNVFSISLKDEALSKFYLMDCDKNSSLKIAKPATYYIEERFSCFYCHNKIDYKTLKDKGYKKGGVPCHDSKSGRNLPLIYGNHKQRPKNCLYCAEDLDDGNNFKPDFMRLLPPSFMQHNNFKIAFTGSKRAGKTTYISRFFDLTSDRSATGKTASMPMTMIGNSLKKFGLDIKAATVAELEREDVYRVAIRNWMDRNEFYTDRAISLDPPAYPQPTTTGSDECLKHPFITEINGNTYVAFYDVAGEDAQTEMPLRNLANGDVIGIFCIINGKRDADSNNAVFSMMKAAKLNENCPVAVIVTKIDMLEDEFDSNSHCLRTNYFNYGKHYEGSHLEKEIDFSSEEIKAYLKQTALLPNIDDAFKNVKYFGVSSFNFIDSIHNDLEDINEPGKVKFECSAKRIELPFIWMLKQFAIIK